MKRNSSMALRRGILAQCYIAQFEWRCREMRAKLVDPFSIVPALEPEEDRSHRDQDWSS